MAAPGPPAFGRGVVVADGGEAPAPWRDAPRVRVDAAVLADPDGVAEATTELHRCWSARRPVVIELAVDPGVLRTPPAFAGAPWRFPPTFTPWLDRLHFLCWANTYDARDPARLRWWWGVRAARLGATELDAAGAVGDVRLPDGSAAWVDGGPRQPLDAASLGAAVVHRDSVELGSLATQPAPRAPDAELAPDQLAAVTHAGGGARVLAPAGSGKTRVLTERLRLLHQRGWEHDAVLAVAYNVRARDELVARTAAFRPRVQTLNSLGFAVVRAARGGAEVLDEREVRRIVGRLAPARQRRANTDPLAPYLEALSLARLGLRDPDAVEASRDDVPGFAALFEAYRAQLARRNALDFDEQVYGAVEHLLADGTFRRDAQARWGRHLLVDEFQDLTPAHLLLLRLLAAPALDLFAVGDDDQVIYGYAGADPAFLVGFDQHVPGASSHPLEVNYRCPAAVVRAAGSLLAYNHRRVAKTIRPGPDAVEARDALDIRRAPAGTLLGQLVEAVGSWVAGGSPHEVAVLTRVNSTLLAPHVALRAAGVPVRSTVGPSLLERTGVRAALAYLRLARTPARMDPADIVEVLRRPSRGLPQWFPERLERRAWWSGDQLAALAGQVGERYQPKVADLAADLSAVAAAARHGSVRRVLEVVRDEVGLDRAMRLLDHHGAPSSSGHLDDLDALVAVADLHPHLEGFEAWLREHLGADADPHGVTLATVHRVKGQEWDRVVVYGVDATQFPHRLADDLEEERRVLHVAVTRCRRQVLLLADEAEPSPFLDELLGLAPRTRPPEQRPGGGQPVARRPARAAAAAGRGGGAIRPTIGLELTVLGGYRGTVAAIDDQGVELALDGGGRLRVRAGEQVTAGTKRGPLAGAGPAPAPALDDPGAQARSRALRAWRQQRRQADDVPAFVVLNDRHLDGIAVRNPTTLEELAGCEGIGPTKLERYGDEILEVLENVATGAPG